jgi:ankyrin repeat protein
MLLWWQRVSAHGADVNLRDRTGRTALICAAAQEHNEGVKLLLKAGADVNICTNTGITALRHAVASGAHETAQLLLDYGADPMFVGSNGESVLVPVVDISHCGGNAVEVVASYGVPLDTVMPNGNTALLEALEVGDVALHLVNAGADVRATDVQEHTAIYKCAKFYVPANGMRVRSVFCRLCGLLVNEHQTSSFSTPKFSTAGRKCGCTTTVQASSGI